MLEEVVVCWQEVRWIWWMKENFVSQFVQLLKRLVVYHVIMCCRGEELGSFCWPELATDVAVYWFAELLRCSGFARIQKVVVDQMGNRPLVTMPFFCLTLGSALELQLGPATELVATDLSYKIHFSSHVTIQPRNFSWLFHRIREDHTSKWFFFFLIFGQLMRHVLNELFYLSNSPPMLRDHGMVNMALFTPSCVVLRGLVSVLVLSWWLSTSHGQPLGSSPGRSSCPTQSFLNHCCIVHLLAIPRSKVVLMLQVVSAAL